MSTDTASGTLDRYFKISERGSSVGREIRGGVVTFFTMAYIIVLNPIIIAGVKDADGNFLGGGSQENAFALVAAGTALVAGVMSILMGAIANFPLALATGLGLNAFVAYSIASKMTWADAMGLVVIEGVVILVLVLTGFRRAVFNAVPLPLKTAISVGIGLFITFVGLINAGIVRVTGNASPPVGLGIDGSLAGWPTVVFCIGLLLMIAFYSRGIRGGILLAILITTVVAVVIQAIFDIPAGNGDPKSTGWNLNVPSVPDTFVSWPDFSLVGHFSLLGSFERVGFVTAVLFVFTLLLADFFDTMGTMTAIGAEADLNDEDGTPEGSQRILIVDSIGAIAGGAASVSSNTAYVESAAGVGDGARTGLASITTGILFLIATVASPLVSHIPNEAAVPALVLVGFLMMQQVVEIDWLDIEVALPAFLIIAFMPFTYSISVGIGAGFLAFVIIKVVRGKVREIHPLMWVVAVMFALYFTIEPITNAVSG